MSSLNTSPINFGRYCTLHLWLLLLIKWFIDTLLNMYGRLQETQNRFVTNICFGNAVHFLRYIILFINKHFESSQKLLKSSFVNERFKKYSLLPNELLTFETTNFKNLKYYWKLYCVHLCFKLVLSILILKIGFVYSCSLNWFCVQLYCQPGFVYSCPVNWFCAQLYCKLVLCTAVL